VFFGVLIVTPMVLFKTEFNGYSVKFSPFDEDKIAVATAQNFGLAGITILYTPSPPQGMESSMS
jgi:hypothetical protein